MSGRYAASIVTIQELIRRTGLGYAAIQRLMASGVCPRPLDPGALVPRWKTSDIEPWISRLPSPRSMHVTSAQDSGLLKIELLPQPCVKDFTDGPVD